MEAEEVRQAEQAPEFIERMWRDAGFEATPRSSLCHCLDEEHGSAVLAQCNEYIKTNVMQMLKDFHSGLMDARDLIKEQDPATIALEKISRNDRLLWALARLFPHHNIRYYTLHPHRQGTIVGTMDLDFRRDVVDSTDSMTVGVLRIDDDERFYQLTSTKKRRRGQGPGEFGTKKACTDRMEGTSVNNAIEIE